MESRLSSHSINTQLENWCVGVRTPLIIGVGSNTLKGDANAALCYEMYNYRIQKFIGAYTAALNGLDSIVFTAGLGENDALTRSFACKHLDFFGIKLDEKNNEELNHFTKPLEIQAADSRVKILIILTNEELQIVNEIVDLVK